MSPSRSRRSNGGYGVHVVSPSRKYLCPRGWGLAKRMLAQSQAFMGQHATEDMTCLSFSEGTMRTSVPRGRATFLESSSADAAPGNYYVRASSRDGFLLYITHQSLRCHYNPKCFSSAPRSHRSLRTPHSLDRPPRTNHSFSTLSSFSPVYIALRVYGAIAPCPPKLSQRQVVCHFRLPDPSLKTSSARIPRASHNESAQDYRLPYVGGCPLGLCAWHLGVRRRSLGRRSTICWQDRQGWQGW